MTSWWLITLALSWGLVLLSVLRTEIALRRNAMAAGIPAQEVPIKPYSRADILGALGVLLVSGALIYKSLASMYAAYDMLKIGRASCRERV